MTAFLRGVAIDEAEAATCVVCIAADETTRGQFPDNVETTCVDCETSITHRPWPHTPRTPPKVCLACFGQRIAASPAPTRGGLVAEAPLVARIREMPAPTRACSCPSPDPFGFMRGGVSCCLTCGGRLNEEPAHG